MMAKLCSINWPVFSASHSVHYNYYYCHY